MFDKIVGIDPLGLTAEAEQELRQLAGTCILYPDLPKEEEIAQRIADADCALVSFRSQISAKTIQRCPNLRYIGMCCSLYDEKSANVDLIAARQQGIEVTGVRDYGDNGVVEFIVSELVRLLHGFGQFQWREQPHELWGAKIGIIGMGATGLLTARALRVFGAEICYYSRTRKPAVEAEGFAYLPLEQLLAHVDILSTHLNKNTIVLHDREFERFGDHKILINTGIGPSFDLEAMTAWLSRGDNYYICDPVAMAPGTESLLKFPKVLCANKGSGGSIQTTQRLSAKVLENMRAFLAR